MIVNRVVTVCEPVIFCGKAMQRAAAQAAVLQRCSAPDMHALLCACDGRVQRVMSKKLAISSSTTVIVYDWPALLVAAQRHIRTVRVCNNQYRYLVVAV